MAHESKMDAPSRNAVFSFFSGAGFLDLGFEEAGFETVFANEINKEFVAGYLHSRKAMGKPVPRHGVACCSIDEMLQTPKSHDLRDAVIASRSRGQTIGFIGGPPCPDFSVGGKNRGQAGDHGRLSRSYVDLVIEQQPDWFVFENVKGLWRTKQHREFFDRLVNDLNAAGFKTDAKLMNSIEFGAPQDRDRIILFGVNRNFAEARSLSISSFNWNVSVKYPERTAFRYNWPARSSFGSAIEQSPVPQELTIQHWFEKNQVGTHPNAPHRFSPRAALPRFLSIEEGDVGKKCFKRLHRQRYSPTACYGNNEVHLHPTEARRLSVAESLAIQSLPREFELPSSMTLSAMFKTVGNGVPFVMAQGIAKSVLSFIGQP